ncbi:MAG TPA: ATP-binding protein [Chryseolinea sp.]|nr:ATP-binding protein [Chryseolinea sp.]
MEKRKDKVFILLIASIVMALICAFITYWGTQEKRDSVNMVIQTYQVIESSERILSLLKDIEAGSRGYLATTDSMFLSPIAEARNLLSDESKKLLGLIRDNSLQENFVAQKIIPAVKSLESATVMGLNPVKGQGRDSAFALADTKVGLVRADTIRHFVNEFIENERISLATREGELEDNIIVEDIVQFSSFAVIAITCTLAFLRLVSERNNINALLEKLEATNEGLEQKVLARTQQLTEANQAKDHFLGIASHDLKVPIAGLLGLIEVMRLENQGRSSKEIEYLGYMEESCNGMENLISNLLDINRIDRGGPTFTRQRIDMFPFLTALEQRFSSYAKNKEVPLQIDMLNTVIESDPGNLLRILENLLSNAIKFSSHGQPVVLHTSLQDHHILFEVTDHGPGIPKAEIPLLFKKFARLTNRPTGGESSSGLGLAIVKELTELAGGEVTVESELGHGSTFILKMPIGEL